MQKLEGGTRQKLRNRRHPEHLAIPKSNLDVAKAIRNKDQHLSEDIAHGCTSKRTTLLILHLPITSEQAYVADRKYCKKLRKKADSFYANTREVFKAKKN